MSALAALTDEECYLVSIMDDPSGIELAEFCFLDETPGKEDPCFRVRDYQWTWWQNEERYQIDHCVAEGQLVLTTRGYVPIETVLVGDEVLTHQNRWRPVTAVLDQGIREVVEVKGQGHFGLRVTPDHELYARRSRRASQPRDGHKGKKLMQPEWLAPQDWEFNDGSGVMTANWASPAEVPTLALPGQMTPAYASGRQNFVADCFTEDWMWLFGLYLAEGSTYADTKAPLRRVVWSVHEREVQMVCSMLEKVGLHYNTHQVGLVVQIAVLSRPAHDWLLEHGGRYSYGKSLPAWALGLPANLRLALLDGMLYGDGSVRPDGTWTYTTVSRSLAFGVRTLAASLDWSVSIWTKPAGTAVIDGRTVNTREVYVLGLKHITSQRQTTTVFENGQAWAAVKTIEPVGTAHVWDLVVADDESFVVEGVVIHNCSRDVGKSQGIQLRAFAFPFNFPGTEMLVTAPELNHLDPITNKIEGMFRRVRLGREMLPPVKGGGVKHQPHFQMSFNNGAVIMGRLPNRDGRGVKGQHSHRIEMDEAQDYPQAGWTELIETMKDTSGAQWRAHGVSRGVRDMYYRMTESTDPDMPFYVHRYMAMNRPGWSPAERRGKISLYGGSRDNPDYKRNIYGDHGDVTNPVFVLARLMACVRISGQSTWAAEYNENVYKLIKIESEVLAGRPISSLIQLPANHRAEAYRSYWAGMDIGYTNDPSELLVFGQVRVKDVDVLRLLTRIHMMRVMAPDQEEVIAAVFDFYGPRLRGLSLDKTGAGLPVWQHMEKDIEHADIRKRVKGYGFSEKKEVEFDDRPLVRGEVATDAMIKKNVIEYATDKLREYVDAGMMELPYDQELLTEFQGQTVLYTRDASDVGSRKTRYGGGSFHTLDAAKMMILGKEQEAIEAALAPTRRGPVLDLFVS